MDSSPDTVRQRWVFGDYVIYARDRFLARDIYEAVSKQPETGEPFGIVTLPAGTGNWLRLGRRRPAPPGSS